MADKIKCHHCNQEIKDVGDCKEHPDVDDFGYPNYKFFHRMCYAQWKNDRTADPDFESDWYA